MEEAFPTQPPANALHVIVKISPDEGDQRPVKRARLSSPIPEEAANAHDNWTHFWEALWGRGVDHFETQNIENRTIELDNRTIEPDDEERKDEKITLPFNVMKIHKAHKLGLKGLLIRDEWNTALSFAEQKSKLYKSFILVGQPGIGKTLSLYYFLSIRLAQGLPTLFQFKPAWVWYFHKDGVSLLPSGLDDWDTIPGISKENRPWALVDSNMSMTNPADFLWGNGSPIFIMQAASPHQDRWHWTKYHGRSWPFYSKPFSLEELLEGNELQETPAERDHIVEFYIKYGPSARQCYDTCGDPEFGMDIYRSKLDLAIEKMSWDSMERILNSKTDLTPQLETEHFLVALIEPKDDKRIHPKVTIIRRTVMWLLWKKHRELLRNKAKELIYVFSKHPKSSPASGWIFEVRVYSQLEDGIDVPLDPMSTRPNNRKGAINDTYETSNTGRDRWKSQPMTSVPYTENDRDLKVEALRYYVPVDPRNATYDSFAFEVVPAAEYDGPIIDPVSMGAVDLRTLSSVGVFTLFGVTEAHEHDAKEKGPSFALLVARNTGLKAVALRYTAVIPAGHQVKILVPIKWRNKMAMFALQIVNYEPSEGSAAV